MEYIIMLLGILLIILGLIIWRQHNEKLILDIYKKYLDSKYKNEYTKAYGIAYIISGSLAFILAINEKLNMKGIENYIDILCWLAFVISVSIVIRTEFKYRIKK